MTLLTIKQVSEVLSVSQSLVYDLVRNSSLSAYKIGGAIRISEEDIAEYLKRRKLKARVPKGLCTTPTTLNSKP